MVLFEHSLSVSYLQIRKLDDSRFKNQFSQSYIRVFMLDYNPNFDFCVLSPSLVLKFICLE